jgi:hypothetical protein
MKSKDPVELSVGDATGFLDFARNDLRAGLVILSASERSRLMLAGLATARWSSALRRLPWQIVSSRGPAKAGTPNSVRCLGSGFFKAHPRRHGEPDW